MFEQHWSVFRFVPALVVELGPVIACPEFAVSRKAAPRRVVDQEEDYGSNVMKELEIIWLLLLLLSFWSFRRC